MFRHIDTYLNLSSIFGQLSDTVEAHRYHHAYKQQHAEDEDDDDVIRAKVETHFLVFLDEKINTLIGIFMLKLVMNNYVEIQ